MNLRKLSAAKCPCCGLIIRRIWIMNGATAIGQRFREHMAPCRLPCKLPADAKPGEAIHAITEECPKCIELCLTSPLAVKSPKAVEALRPVPYRPARVPPQPPEPKPPWDRIVIPPHALKMVKIRAGFESVVDAAILIETLYPLTHYCGSQKTAQGTSHTKRTKPGKAKNRSQRVDLYCIFHGGSEWVFYMKRNVLMTVHRNARVDAISEIDV